MHAFGFPVEPEENSQTEGSSGELSAVAHVSPSVAWAARSSGASTTITPRSCPRCRANAISAANASAKHRSVTNTAARL